MCNVDVTIVLLDEDILSDLVSVRRLARSFLVGAISNNEPVDEGIIETEL